MFTKENAREMQLRAWRATMERTSPERRSLSSRRAALARWYPLDGDPKKRLTAILRFLARMAKSLELEGDYAGAARAVMAMLPLELQLVEIESEAQHTKDVTREPADTKSGDKLVTHFGAETPSPKKTNLLN